MKQVFNHNTETLSIKVKCQNRRRIWCQVLFCFLFFIFRKRRHKNEAKDKFSLLLNIRPGAELWVSLVWPRLAHPLFATAHPVK